MYFAIQENRVQLLTKEEKMNMLIRNRLNSLPLFGSHNTGNFLKEIDSFASELFKNVSCEGFCPVFDIEESKKFYKITAELPGMELNDIDVTLKENSIVISGEKKSEKGKDEEEYHYAERKYGKFERVFNLGEDVDLENIKAIMKNGVLTVILSKTEKAVNTPKKIEVTKG
jgi:HSP20 family protein